MDKISQDKKINLLIVTQSLDLNDPILGFFHRWVEEFSKHCNKLTIICLRKGEYNLPDNVKVLSLGKEEFEDKTSKKSSTFFTRLTHRLQYTFRFYKYIYQERANYDSIFVHMNQIYVILGGLVWRIFSKRISMWYAHGAVPKSLIIAEKITNIIFSSTKSGFNLKSKKVNIVGQGIDINLFKRNSNICDFSKKINALSVGRISKIKDYETIIKAIKMLVDRGVDIRFDMVGDFNEDSKYFLKLNNLIRDNNLDGRVLFLGSVKNIDLSRLLNKYDLFINSSDTGSLDKALLEAMSCKLAVFSSNKSFKNIMLGDLSRFVFSNKDSNDLSYKISSFIESKNKEEPLIKMRNIVVERNNIESLVEKIIINF